MCFKEHQNLESKCELAKEKVDSEHGQNQRYGAIGGHHWQGCIPSILDLCLDQAILSIFYLRTNIWMGLLDLGDIDREVTEIGWHVTFVTPGIIS